MNEPVFPKSKFSYREYQYFPNDGMRHEIIDGDHFISPAPSTKHQTVSRRLKFQIYTQIELTGKGQIFNAPTDVELAAHDIVQPDLIIVMRPNFRMIGSKRIRGVPDLAIEILSESNPQHDRVLKLEMYQRVGLPEYWIVDPEEEYVDAYVLKEGILVLVGTFRDAIESQTIPGTKINLTEVWNLPTD